MNKEKAKMSERDRLKDLENRLLSYELSFITDSALINEHRKAKFISQLHKEDLKRKQMKKSKHIQEENVEDFPLYKPSGLIPKSILKFKKSRSASKDSDVESQSDLGKVFDNELSDGRISIKLNKKKNAKEMKDNVEVMDNYDIQEAIRERKSAISKTSKAAEKHETKLKKRTKKSTAQSDSVSNKSSIFHKHIMKVAKSKKASSGKKKILLTERETNLDVFKNVNILRYRENVFRAASKLSNNLPPFPAWSYKNRLESDINIIKINVGGTLFEVFDETIMNLPHTKLSDIYLYHSNDVTLFFDRDSSCFSAVLNFYRTGKLHAPASSCLSFFEEELVFWGINEDIMEPCCCRDYFANKNICNTLNRYMESMQKPLKKHLNQTHFGNARHEYNMISVSEVNSIYSRWYCLIYTLAIFLTIITLIITTCSPGRIDIKTNKISPQKPNESLIQYFHRTQRNPRIVLIEMVLNGFFLLDFCTRFFLCSNKLRFFTDMVNWCDFIVIMSSVITELPMVKHSEQYETFPLVLKIPRLFRIFRLTKVLRFGLDSFLLTLRSSSSELLLVFIITIISTCFYGVLIYVVEMINESPGKHSSFTSVSQGMWWAIVTMSTVGIGDFVPKSSYGFVVGYFCILTGIIITQLPVPIFLKNFSIYYNQISARMQLVNAVLSSNVDPETIGFPDDSACSSRISRHENDTNLLKET